MRGRAFYNIIGAPIRFFIIMGKKHKMEWYIVIIGGLILSIIVLSSIFAHTLAPYDPLTEVGPRLTPPNSDFIMGTNNLGFDVYSRILHGSRTILIISIAAALFSATVGIPIGLFSGYSGGKIDRLLSLIMDSVYSFPGLILAIVMAAMLGPGIINISLAISVIYIPTYFRMVRGQTMTIKEDLYVEAARSIGASSTSIMFRYIFPNVIASVVVIFSLNVADAILTEAGLSYLGLGLPPDLPDWGIDLAKGKNFIPLNVWWVVSFPGMMITLVALSFTMIGEGLSEILNPRLKEK